MNRRSFVPLLVALLSGCAASGPIFKPPEDADPGNALVYIYRGTGVAFGARSAYFYVNDVNVFDLNQGGYSWVSLPPGNYRLKQSWPADIFAKSIELDLEVHAGETRYFSFETGTCQGGYREICLQWRFQGQSPDTGRLAIADKRFQQNFGASKLRLLLNQKP